MVVKHVLCKSKMSVFINFIQYVEVKNNIMKNILIIAFFAISIACNGQVTVTKPLYSYDPDTYQNGTYYEDLNNVLGYYEGTWKGTLDTKEYTFVFVKFIQQLNGVLGSNNYNYEDELMIKYQVKDITTNEILYSDFNITNYDDFKITGLALKYGLFNFWYKNRVPNYCLNSIEFILIKINGQPNQLRFDNVWYDYYDSSNCPFADQQSIPSFIPNTEMIFTKQ